MEEKKEAISASVTTMAGAKRSFAAAHKMTDKNAQYYELGY